MSRFFTLAYLSLILTGPLSLIIQPAEAENAFPDLTFTLAAWKDDKQAAFVLYSDDSMIRSIKSGWTLENPDVPYDGYYTLGKKYGIPITLFVIPRLMDDGARGDRAHVYYSSLHPPSIHAGAGGSWADWKFMHEQGHEIASHSYSHTDFRPGPDGKPTSSADPHIELGDAVVAITTQIGEKPLSMNFSYGAPTDDILKIARQYTPLTEEDFSSDRQNVRKAAFGSDTGAAYLIAEMEKALAAGQCLILGGHGIRTELGRREEAAPDFHDNGIRWDGYKPVEYAALEGLFQFLDKNREQIYIDAFKNVSRYLAERKASSLTIRRDGDNTVQLDLTHDLDPELYKLPLTLRIDSQQALSNVSVFQAGKAVSARSHGDAFLVDVIPNGGSIKISLNP